MIDEEYPWYEDEVNRNITFWNSVLILSIIISLSTSLIAALLTSSNFDSWRRVALIALSIVGAGITGAAQAFRFKEKEALRENGRIELFDIIHNVRSNFVNAKTEEEYRLAYHSTRERFRLLEISQHHGYHALHSEPVPNAKVPSV